MARRKRNTHNYRSNFEAGIAEDLEARRVPFSYETLRLDYWLKKPRCECDKCGSTDIYEKHTYTPDFILLGGDLIVEAKGKFTPRNRKTMLAVTQQHPDLNIRMLFMDGRDNWLTKKQTMRYSDWCKKNRIEYAFGRIPEEWLIDES